MTRETLDRMMKLLKIPEEKWDHIAKEELRANKSKLKEEAKRSKEILSSPRDSSLRSEEKLLLPEHANNLLDEEKTPSVEFSDRTLRFEDDDPFEDLQVKDLWNRFKLLHHQLLKDRKHENTNKTHCYT